MAKDNYPKYQEKHRAMIRLLIDEVISEYRGHYFHAPYTCCLTPTMILQGKDESGLRLRFECLGKPEDTSLEGFFELVHEDRVPAQPQPSRTPEQPNKVTDFAVAHPWR